MNHGARDLFFHLLHLIGAGVQLIGVYDGPRKPQRKRGQELRGHPEYVPYIPSESSVYRGNGEKQKEQLPAHIEWLSKKMLNLLGIPYRTAAGEAEAECAALNKAELADAVLTTDGDAFVFGAKTVYTVLSGKKLKAVKQAKKDGVMIEVHRLKKDLEDGARQRGMQPLTQRNLQVLAVLYGEGYSGGLKGCGPKLALKIARSKYGSRLQDLHKMEKPEKLQESLEGWRKQLVSQLQNNSEGLFDRPYPAVAAFLEEWKSPGTKSQEGPEYRIQSLHSSMSTLPSLVRKSFGVGVAWTSSRTSMSMACESSPRSTLIGSTDTSPPNSSGTWRSPC